MARTKTRNEARKKRHARVRRKIYGTAERPRLNVFRSLTQIYAQLIDDEAGHTLVSASTIEPEIAKEVAGMSKAEQANVVGTKLAERAKEKKLEEVVFDRGGYRYIGRIKSLAEGAREGGLKF